MGLLGGHGSAWSIGQLTAASAQNIQTRDAHLSLLSVFPQLKEVEGEDH